MSSLDFKYNIIDKWKNFSNVYVGASIDGVADVAEIIRYGTIWKTIESNLKRVKQLPNIKLGIDTVVSIFNIDHLPDMYTYLIDNDIIDEKTGMSFNIAFDPLPFSLTGLPSSHKLTVEQKLSNWATTYNGPNKDQMQKSVASMIKFMYSKDTYDPYEYIFSFEERLGVQFEQAKTHLHLPFRIYQESLVATGGKKNHYSNLK